MLTLPGIYMTPFPNSANSKLYWVWHSTNTQWSRSSHRSSVTISAWVKAFRLIWCLSICFKGRIYSKANNYMPPMIPLFQSTWFENIWIPKLWNIISVSEEIAFQNWLHLAKLLLRMVVSPFQHPFNNSALFWSPDNFLVYRSISSGLSLFMVECIPQLFI